MAKMKKVIVFSSIVISFFSGIEDMKRKRESLSTG